MKITWEIIKVEVLYCDGVFMDSLKHVSIKNLFHTFMWHYCNNLGYIVLHYKPKVVDFIPMMLP